MIKSREESKLNRKEKVAKRNSEIKEKLHIKRRIKNWQKVKWKSISRKQW